MIENVITKLKRRCEECGASYATGKDYGFYWLERGFTKEIIIADLPIKGLCEFCNSSSIWYNKK
jgi:hypothetical protein